MRGFLRWALATRAPAADIVGGLVGRSQAGYFGSQAGDLLALLGLAGFEFRDLGRLTGIGLLKTGDLLALGGLAGFEVFDAAEKGCRLGALAAVAGAV